jgi:hypothetical protein
MGLGPGLDCFCRDAANERGEPAVDPSAKSPDRLDPATVRPPRAAATGNRSDTNRFLALQPPSVEESFSSCSAGTGRYSLGCGPR